ncbi:MAG: hypothetical protein EBV84_08585 [Betaproteobacteria bacterium]|nr:hypothetical protein [Betaproteobacteria bacterium]NDE45624.1 hypothetical protein [Betaproteobacteria bacterium]
MAKAWNPLGLASLGYGDKLCNGSQCAWRMSCFGTGSALVWLGVGLLPSAGTLRRGFCSATRANGFA